MANCDSATLVSIVKVWTDKLDFHTHVRDRIITSLAFTLLARIDQLQPVVLVSLASLVNMDDGGGVHWGDVVDEWDGETCAGVERRVQVRSRDLVFGDWKRVVCEGVCGFDLRGRGWSL